MTDCNEKVQQERFRPRKSKQQHYQVVPLSKREENKPLKHLKRIKITGIKIRRWQDRVYGKPFSRYSIYFSKKRKKSSVIFYFQNFCSTSPLFFLYICFFFSFLYSFLILLFTRHQSPFQLIFKRKKKDENVKKYNVETGNFCTEAKNGRLQSKKKRRKTQVFHKKNNHTQLKEKKNTIDYV